MPTLGLLATTLAALLCGKPATGAAPNAPAAEPVTFAHDIAPVLYGNCVSCHHDGGGGPFALMSYKDAAKRAALLAQVTQDRQMPPWKAEADYGKFQNERHLTAEQIELFTRWANAGAPAGDLATAPKPPAFANSPEWPLGKPDLVVTLPQPFTVPASGRDVYRCFVLPLNIPEDKFVSAVDFHPSNRTVVHHALFFLDQAGKARRLEQQFHAEHPEDNQIGYARFGGPGFLPGGGLGGWAPGALPSFLPETVARSLPRNSDLVIQTHLHPSGKAETEQSTIGIYFAKKPPQHTMLPLILGNRQLDIPAGEKQYVATADWQLPADVTLVGITPHAHLVCRSMDVWATIPLASGEKKVPLIRINDWDFDWQGTYRYVEPLRLPAGATIHMRYVYDNSADNERNPNTPPKPVRTGEQTTDEMAYCFLEGYATRPLDALALRLSMMQALRNRKPARLAP
jgi:hypothetical protein